MMCKNVNFSYLDFRARIRAVNQNPRQILVSNIILIGIKPSQLTIQLLTTNGCLVIDASRSISSYDVLGVENEVSRGTLRQIDTKSVF